MSDRPDDISDNDLLWMRYALALAHDAARADEVPVGAVLVRDGVMVGEGFNQPITTHDATAHAEIVAMRMAGRALESYRLLDTTLYVTLEPCAMCAGAMIHARVGRLVYGAPDPKSGACGSVLDVIGCPALNHRIDTTGGVLGEHCGTLLRRFFAARR